ncbi:hypothetical protein QQE94_07585 [Fervidobacterium pennivorans subsp. shakshaketiis]|uniref:hypothetical protein n=1 Tax=Fervidobacterium pennivorans TaxID=93466 RepID=UPI001436C7A0|nr:hypothetical protein [Fervidobacterium pennivorans]QIV78712.1 hypothetical protein HER11_07080 [Fervidobacterium pennivorans subsp. keratinolyticus]
MKQKLFKVFVLITTLIALKSFASGTFYALIEPGGTTWNQILTFTVKQTVKVEWQYDETQPVPVDREDSEVVVGFIRIYSNKQFKISANVYVSEASVRSLVVPKQVKFGSETTGVGEVLIVTPKNLQGNLSIVFDIDWENLQTEEFPVVLEFTFYPF